MTLPAAAPQITTLSMSDTPTDGPAFFRVSSATRPARSGSHTPLHWKRSTWHYPDTGGSGLAGYKVFRAGSQVGTTATTGYSETGLTGSTLYCYTVTAYDNAGNASAASVQACATTPAPTG